jgi:hypothetical protein
MSLLLQLCQQGEVAEIFLKINGAGFIYIIDLGYGASPVAKVAAEIDESLIFPDVVVISGDIGALFRPHPEIDAVTAGLRDDIQSDQGVAAILFKKFSDLLDDSLHIGVGLRAVVRREPVKVRRIKEWEA